MILPLISALLHVFCGKVLLPKYQLKLDFLRSVGKGANLRRAGSKGNHSEDAVIQTVHTAEFGVGLQHSRLGLPALIFADCRAQTNPFAPSHSVDLNLRIRLHLLIDGLLIVGADANLPIDDGGSAKGTDMRLTVFLSSSEIERLGVVRN